MARNAYKYAALILFGSLLFQDWITSGFVEARIIDGALFINGGDNTEQQYFGNTGSMEKEDLGGSEIGNRLRNIEKDLKTLKVFGPLFIYLLSDSKKWYKLLMMIGMYFFFFTLCVFYRKARRGDETVNENAEAATGPKVQETEVNSAHSCTVDIPDLNEV